MFSMSSLRPSVFLVSCALYLVWLPRVPLCNHLAVCQDSLPVWFCDSLARVHWVKFCFPLSCRCYSGHLVSPAVPTLPSHVCVYWRRPPQLFVVSLLAPLLLCVLFSVSELFPSLSIPGSWPAHFEFSPALGPTPACHTLTHDTWGCSVICESCKATLADSKNKME